jgi:hypothetical protein
MTYVDEELLEQVRDNALRQHNRALRIVTRSLREKTRTLSDEYDSLVRAVLETETEAERALRELWERGGFQCSPRDYDGIVERCIELIRYVEIPHEPHRL